MCRNLILSVFWTQQGTDNCAVALSSWKPSFEWFFNLQVVQFLPEWKQQTDRCTMPRTTEKMDTSKDPAAETSTPTWQEADSQTAVWLDQPVPQDNTQNAMERSWVHKVDRLLDPPSPDCSATKPEGCWCQGESEDAWETRNSDSCCVWWWSLVSCVGSRFQKEKPGMDFNPQWRQVPKGCAAWAVHCQDNACHFLWPVWLGPSGVCAQWSRHKWTSLPADHAEPLPENLLHKKEWISSQFLGSASWWCTRTQEPASVLLLPTDSNKSPPPPPYSPDLNPLDYWLFARLKAKVWGERFCDLVQLQNTLDQEIAQITPQEWGAAMDRLVPRLHRCIQAAGQYFERE